MTEEEAKKQIEDAKLVFEKDKEEYDKEVEAGKVISQKTEIGEYMKVVGNLTVKGTYKRTEASRLEEEFKLNSKILKIVY